MTHFNHSRRVASTTVHQHLFLLVLTLVCATAAVAAPSPPTGCVATPGAAQVTVAWDEVSGATSYTVYRTTTSGSGYSPLISGYNGTSFIDTTAVNDTTYYYVVTAVDGTGESGYSNEDDATPRAGSYVSGVIGSYDTPMTTTWDLAGSPYIVTGDVYVRGDRNTTSDRTSTLIIESGVEVYFEPGTALHVGHTTNVAGYRGRLQATGVTFSSNTSVVQPGYWNGIRFLTTTSAAGDGTFLDSCTVEGTGGGDLGGVRIYRATVTLRNNTRVVDGTAYGVIISSTPDSLATTEYANVTITDSEIEGHGTYPAVWIGDWSWLALTQTTLSGGSYPMEMEADARLTALAGNSFDTYPVEQRGIAVPGEVMGSYYRTQERTWPGGDLPYIITADLTVRGDRNTTSNRASTLVIEPGAEVRFDAGVRLNVGSNTNVLGYAGKLQATGATFTANSAVTPNPGFWRGFYFYDSATDDASFFDGCVVEGAGEGGASAVRAYKSDIELRNGTIVRDVGAAGVELAGITDAEANSQDLDFTLTITGCQVAGGPESPAVKVGDRVGVTLTGNAFTGGAYPVEIAPNTKILALTGSSLGTFPPDQDAVAVVGGTMGNYYRTQSLTWPGGDLEYVVLGDFTIRGDRGASYNRTSTLVVGPAAVVRFAAGVRLYVGSNSSSGVLGYGGRLQATGVTFKANQQVAAPGFWRGIYFADSAIDGAANNFLDSCVIEGAGADTSPAVVVRRCSVELRNTTIHTTGDGAAGVEVQEIAESERNTIPSAVSIASCAVAGGAGVPAIRIGEWSHLSLTGTTLSGGTYPVELAPNSKLLELAGNSLVGYDYPHAGIAVVGGTMGNYYSTQERTWFGGDLPFVVLGDLVVRGNRDSTYDRTSTLTIEPGTVVKMTPNCSLTIGSNNSGNVGIAGKLHATGVTFTPDQETVTPGYWRRIYFADSAIDDDNYLDGCVVEGAGYDDISAVIVNKSSVALNNVTVRDVAAVGVDIYGVTDSEAGSIFPAVTITGSEIGGGASFPAVKAGEGASLSLTGTVLTGGSYAAQMTPRTKIPALSGNSLGTFAPGTDGIAVVEGLLGSYYRTESRTWPGGDLDYIVVGNVTVRGDRDSSYNRTATLIIEPDAVVRFDEETRLIIGSTSSDNVGVAGKLQATGVTFKANQETPTPGYWRGLYFADSTIGAGGETFLDDCVVAGTGALDTAAVTVNKSHVILRNGTVVRDVSGAGVYAVGTTDAQGTLSSTGIDGCELAGGPGSPAVRAGDWASVSVTGTSFHGGSYPIEMAPAAFLTALAGNSLSGYPPEQSGIAVLGTTAEVTATQAGSYYRAETRTWPGNDLPYIVDGTVTFRGNRDSSYNRTSTLVIGPGAEVRFKPGAALDFGSNNSSNIGISGQIQATQSLFTANSTAPTTGFWKGIRFWNSATDGANNFMDDCIVEYGGYLDDTNSDGYNVRVHLSAPAITATTSRYSSFDGILVTGSGTNPAFSGCRLLDNVNGLRVTNSGTASISESDIYDNSAYGVKNDVGSSVTVMAENNWWGYDTGPYDDSDADGLINPTGEGNPVTDYVDYDPWRSSPSQAPLPPTGLVAQPGDEFVDLAWNASPESPLDGYNVYRRAPPTTTWTWLNDPDPLPPVADPSYHDAPLTNDTEYCYSVAAINPAGEGDKADEVCTTPKTDVTPPVWNDLVGVQFAEGGDGQAILRFEPATDDISAVTYNVYYSTTSPVDRQHVDTVSLLGLMPQASTAGYSLELPVPGLANGTRYFFNVQASDAKDNEDGNAVEATALVNVGSGAGVEQSPWSDATFDLTEVDPSGHVVLTAGETLGTLTTPVLTLPAGSDLAAVAWNALTPAGTAVDSTVATPPDPEVYTVEVRCADLAVEVAAAPWVEVAHNQYQSLPAGYHAQLRVTLRGDGVSSPRLRSLSVGYADLRPPQPPVVTTAVTLTRAAAQTISGSVEPGADLYLAGLLADEAVDPSDSDWSVDLEHAGEQLHSFELTARDAAGNTSLPTTLEVIVDLTPPTLESSTPVHGSSLNPPPASVVIVLSDSGGAEVDEAATSAAASVVDSGGTAVPGGWVTAENTLTYNISGTLADDQYQVQINATDTVGNVSILVVDFTVDTVPPSVSLDPVTSPTAEDPYTLTGGKEAGTAVWINGEEAVAANSSTTWSYAYDLGEGLNSITVYSQDAAGNASDPVTAEIELDTTPPAWSGIAGAGFAEAGDTTVTVRWEPAFDARGEPVTYTLYYDTSPVDFETSPTLAADVPQAGLGYSYETTVTGLPNNTPVYVALRVNDDLGNTDTNTRVLAGWPQVTAGAVVQPEELAWSTGETSNLIENVNGELELAAGSDQGGFTSAVVDAGAGNDAFLVAWNRPDGTVPDPAVTLEMRAADVAPVTNAAGQPWQPGNLPGAGDPVWEALPWAGVTNGEHETLPEGRYVQVRASLERLDGSSPRLVSISVAFADTDLPQPPQVVTYTTPATTTEQWIDGTVEPGLHVYVNGVLADDSTADGTWTARIFHDEGDGPYSFAVTAREASGNESPATEIVVERDATPPVVVELIPAADSSSAPFSEIIIRLADPHGVDEAASLAGASVIYPDGTADLGNWTTTAEGELRYTQGSSSEGTFTVTVFPTDDLGNRGELQYSFGTDGTPPPPPILNPVTSPTAHSPQTLSGAKNADTAVWLRRDGEPAYTQIVGLDSEITWSYSLTLSEGENLFYVTATDEAGNRSEHIDATIVLDTTPPAAPLVTTYTADTTEPSQTVEGTADAGTTLYRGGTLIATVAPDGTWSDTITLPAEGAHLLSYTVRDEVGNQSPATEITVNYDLTAPQLVGSVPADGSSVTAIAGGHLELLLSDALAGVDEELSRQGAQVLFNNTVELTGSWDTTQEDHLFFTPASAFQEGDYRVTIYPADILGNAGGAAFVTFRYDGTAPDDVSDLVATSGDEQVALTWTASPSADAVDQVLYRRQVGGAFGAGRSLGAAVTSTVDTGLTNDTAYEYRLTVLDRAHNESPGVTSAPVTPEDTEAPLPVANLSATAGHQQVRLSWQIPANQHDDLADHLLTVRETASSTTIYADVSLGAAAISYTVTALTNLTEYTFVVAAVDEVVDGGGQHLNQSTSQVTATPENTAAPPDVSDLAAHAGDASVDLEWTPVGDPEGDLDEYRLTVDEVGGGNVATDVPLATDATFHRVTGLGNGSTYSFRISAADTDGNVTAGVSITATPVAFPVRWVFPVDVPWSSGLLSDLAGTAEGALRPAVAGGTGTYTSPVLDLGKPGTSSPDRSLLWWVERALAGSSIALAPGGSPEIEVRTSDLRPSAWAPDTLPWTNDPVWQSLPWQTLGRASTLPPGRYLQMRVTLHGSAGDARYPELLKLIVLTRDHPADGTPPEEVTNLEAQPGNDSVLLSCSPGIDSAGDQVDTVVHVVDAYAQETVVSAGDLAQYRVEGLSNGEPYSFRVTSRDASMNESSGATVEETPDNVAAPLDVTGLAAHPADGFADLEWQAPADVENDLDHLRIELARGGGAVVERSFELAADDTATTLQGLANDTEYTVTVTAVDAAGLSSLGASVSFTPLAAADAWIQPRDTEWQAGDADQVRENGSRRIELVPDGSGYVASGVYTSPVHDLRKAAGTVWWEAIEPDGAVVDHDPAAPGLTLEYRAAGERPAPLPLVRDDFADDDLSDWTPGSAVDPAATATLSAVGGRVVNTGQELAAAGRPVTLDDPVWRLAVTLLEGDGSGSARFLARAGGSSLIDLSGYEVVLDAARLTVEVRKWVNGTYAVLLRHTAEEAPLAGGFVVGRRQTGFFELVRDGRSLSADLDLSEQDLNPFDLVDRLEMLLDPGAFAVEHLELQQAWRSDLAPAADDPTWSSLVWQPIESGDLTTAGSRYVQLRTTLQASPDASATPQVIRGVVGSTTAAGDTTPPADVTGLVATGYNGFVELSWIPSSSDDVVDQILYVDDGSGYDGGTRLGPVVVGRRVDGLSNGLQHIFKLVVEDHNQNFSAGATAAATPDDLMAPEDVTGFTLTPGNQLLDVSWQPSLNSEGDLDIQRLTVELGATVVALQELGPAALSHRFAGLTNGSEYLVRLVLVDTTGNESAGVTASATPGNQLPPENVTELEAEVHHQRVDLTWEASADSEGDLAGYHLATSDDNGTTWSPLDDLEATATATTVDSLTNGVTYSFKITAFDNDGMESSGAFVNAAPANVDPPEPVTGFSGNLNGAQAELTWSLPVTVVDNDLAAVVVEVSSDGGATYGGAEELAATATAHAVAVELDGTTYTFRVRTQDTAGNRSTPATTEVSTGDDDPPAEVGNFRAFAGEDHVVLTWLRSPHYGVDLVDQVLYVSVGVSGNWDAGTPLGPAATSYTVGELDLGQTYFFKLVCADASNVSDGVETSAITVDFPDLWRQPEDTAWHLGQRGELVITGDNTLVLSADGIVAGSAGHTSPVHDLGGYAKQLQWLAQELGGTAVDSSPGEPRTLEFRAADVPPVRAEPTVSTDFSGGMGGWQPGSVVLEPQGQLAVGGGSLVNTSYADGLGMVTRPITLTPDGWVLDLDAKLGSGGVITALLVSSGTDAANWSGYRLELTHGGGSLTAEVTKVVLGQETLLLSTSRSGVSDRQQLRVLMDVHGALQVIRDGENLTRYATTRVADSNPFSSFLALELGLAHYQRERGYGVHLSRFWSSDQTPAADDPVWSGLAWHTVQNEQSVGIPAGRFVQLRSTLQAAGGESPVLLDTVVGTVDPQQNPDTTPPEPATGLAASTADGSVSLTWTPSPSADLAGQTLFVDSVEVMDLAAGATGVTVDGLTNGVTYSFKIRSFDFAGNWSDSASVQATPADAQPPADVLGLVATPGNGLVDLSWQPNPANQGISYNKEVQISDGGSSYSASIPAGSTSYRVTGLTNGVTYSFTLFNIDGAGNYSSPGATASATPGNAVPPEDVTQLVAFPGDGLVDLEWSPSVDSQGDATATLVYQSDDDGHNWTQLDTLGAQASDYRASGLTNGHFYTYRVAVRDGGGLTSAGATIRVSPQDFPAIWAQPADTAWAAGSFDAAEVTGDGQTVRLTSGVASGTYTSPVHDMGTRSSIAWWIADELHGTLIDAVPGGDRTIEVRASDSHPQGWAPYDQDALPPAGDPVWSTLPYHEVTAGEDFSALVDGRYVQYRVTLHSDATRSYSPELHRAFIGTVAGPGSDTDPPADVSALAAAPGNGEVALAWQASPSADVVEHIVRVYDGAILVDLLSLGPGETAVTVTGLTNEQLYGFTVSVSDGWSESRGVSVTATPSDSQPPPEVVDLTVAPGRQRLHLSWTAPEDADGDLAAIKVYHRLQAGGSDVLEATLGATATGYTILGLADGTAYVVTVRTVDVADNHSAGVSVTATPANVTAPEEITDLSAVAGDGRVDLRWTAPADSEGDLAKLRLYVNDGTGYGTGRDLASDAVYHQVAGLDNGTSYAFLITAVDSAGNESQGVVTSATPVTFDDYWHNPIDSSWTDAFYPASQYGLRINSGNEIVLNAEGIRVGGAIFSSGVHDFGENGAKVCWRARELRATSISRVEVRSSRHPPATNIIHQPWEPDQRPDEWSGTSSWREVLNGLGGGFPEGRYVQYRVTLTPDPDQRYSPVLRYALVSTDDGSDCSPPEDVTALEAFPDDGFAYFTWTESANSEGDLAKQTIYYSTDNGFNWSPGQNLDPFATYYRADGLTNFVEHIFRITASDVHGNESLGTSVVATPVDLTAPDAISDLHVTLAGSTAYLSWTASADSEGDLHHYLIEVTRDGEADPFRELTVGAGATSATVEELEPSENYIFTVYAADEVPNLSEGVSGTVGDGEPPEEITSLDLAPGHTIITVSWGASPDTAGDLDGYHIWVDSALAATVDALTTYHRLSGLDNGTTYNIRVSAFDRAGNELPGPDQDATPLATPEVQVLPLASPWGTGQLNNVHEVGRQALELVPGAEADRPFADGGSYLSPVVDLGYDLGKAWLDGLLPPATAIDTIELRASEVPPATNAAGDPWQPGDYPGTDPLWGLKHETFDDDFSLADYLTVTQVDPGITIEESDQELRIHGVTETVSTGHNRVDFEPRAAPASRSPSI